MISEANFNVGIDAPTKIMNCPVCEHPQAEEIVEEVDIGVGIQRHTVGVDCPKCGQIAACSACGSFDGHETWCNA